MNTTSEQLEAILTEPIFTGKYALKSHPQRYFTNIYMIYIQLIF